MTRHRPPYWVTGRMAPPRHHRYLSMQRPHPRHAGVEFILMVDGSVYAREKREPFYVRDSRGRITDALPRPTFPWRKVREASRR